MSNPTQEKIQQRLERLLGYLKADPSNLTLRRDAARTAIDARRFETTLEIAGADGEGVLSDPELTFLRGTALLALSRFEEAGSVFKQMVQEGRGGTATVYNVAVALAGEGDFAALSDFLGKSDPAVFDEIADTHRLAALGDYHAGRLSEGIKRLRNLVSNAPSDPEAWGLLALMEFDNGDNTNAESAATHALNLRADQPYALLALGGLQLERREGQEARTSFETIVKGHPGTGRAWSGLGFAHLLLLDFASAMEDFKKAVELMPDHIGTWHGLAWLQIMEKDLDGAEKSLQRAMAIDRNFGETHGGLAVIAAMRGQSAEAERMARRATGLDPRSFSGRYAKAILAGNTDPMAGQDLISKILDSAPITGGPSVRALARKASARPKVPRPR